MIFEGVLGRQIILRDEFVEINVTSLVERGLGIPSVKVNYENISSIELKKGDIWMKGSMQFMLGGSGYERGSERNLLPKKNPYLIYIPFGKHDEAVSFVEEVNIRIANKKTKVLSPTQSAQPNQPDILDQLSKLSSLKDQGIITEDEFNRKKTELLSRL